MIVRSLPAPASCANRASRRSKSGLETPLPTYQWLSPGGRHEGGDVEPFVAVMAEGDRPLPARRPDPARDRLQPDAVLVRAEERDRPAGVARFFRGEYVGEFFLKAACSSGLAAAGF